MDAQEAAEALAAAVQTDDAGQPVPAQPAGGVTPPTIPGDSGQPAPQGQPEPTGTPEATQEEAVEFFSTVNPDDLPDELKPLAKQLQGDYTRKTQEIAPLRRVAEEVGVEDPDQMRAALSWYSALQQDPNAALTFYQTLGETLGSYGLLPDQPGAVGQPGVAEGVPGAEGAEDEFGMEDLDPNNPLVKMVGQLADWQQQIEQEMLEAQLERQLSAQEQAIRQTHPEWTDQDLDRVAQIAFSYGGDLMKAASDYDAWRNDMISGYIQSKASVPAAGTVPSGGSAQQPIRAADFLTDRGEIDWVKLNAAGAEALRQAEAELG